MHTEGKALQTANRARARVVPGLVGKGRQALIATRRSTLTDYTVRADGALENTDVDALGWT